MKAIKNRTGAGVHLQCLHKAGLTSVWQVKPADKCFSTSEPPMVNFMLLTENISEKKRKIPLFSVPHQLGPKACFNICISKKKLQQGCPEQPQELQRCKHTTQRPKTCQWIYKSLYHPLLLAPGSSDCSTHSAQPLHVHRVQMAQLHWGHRSWRCGWRVTRLSKGQETCAVPQVKVRNASISAQNDCPGKMLWVLQIYKILSAGGPKIQRPGLLKESYCQAKDETY